MENSKANAKRVDGAAIICLHGCPGSRIDFERQDAAAESLGAQLISIDRPGIGLSSPDPKGTVFSFAKDVEELTDALKLKQYAILVSKPRSPRDQAEKSRVGQQEGHIH